jgi:hypothetical protein
MFYISTGGQHNHFSSDCPWKFISEFGVGPPSDLRPVASIPRMPTLQSRGLGQQKQSSLSAPNNTTGVMNDAPSPHIGQRVLKARLDQEDGRFNQDVVSYPFRGEKQRPKVGVIDEHTDSHDSKVWQDLTAATSARQMNEAMTHYLEDPIEMTDVDSLTGPSARYNDIIAIEQVENALRHRALQYGVELNWQESIVDLPSYLTWILLSKHGLNWQSF